MIRSPVISEHVIYTPWNLLRVDKRSDTFEDDVHHEHFEYEQLYVG